MTASLVIALVVVFIGIILISRGIRVVPQEHAWVVERFGRYHRTLSPGLNLIIPLFDRIAYRFDLREAPIDVAEQACITKDNTQIMIDGVLYLKITDAKMAAYGTSSPFAAVEQLAQTVMRSAVGKKDLDEVLYSREELNDLIISELDKAAVNWGVKVLRYEISKIQPPEAVVRAMELQITAERERRAMIARSEGEQKQKANIAEGDKQARVLEAEGEAEAIEAVAKARANAIGLVAEALKKEGGDQAMQMRLASDMIDQFGRIAKEGNTMIVPADMGDLSRTIATALKIGQQGSGNAR